MFRELELKIFERGVEPNRPGDTAVVLRLSLIKFVTTLLSALCKGFRRGEWAIRELRVEVRLADYEEY